MTATPADFENVRWKLARAKEQLDGLRQEIGPFVDDPPYRVVVERKGDVYELRVRIDRSPPEADWSGRIGEIAYNARSALDQLIVQLVVASGATPRAKARTQYPIFVDRDAYLGKARGRRVSRRDQMLEGVASKFRRVVDDSQPFMQPGRLERHPLAVLNMISNRDKHRSAHPCLVTPRSWDVQWRAAGGPWLRMVTEVTEDTDAFVPLHDGDRLATLRLDSSEPLPEEPEVRTGDDFALYVAFDTDAGVVTLDDLERIVGRVSEIVGRAESRMVGGGH